MLRAQLVGLSWRMQGIRKEQRTRNEVWLRRAKNCRLAPAIRVAAQENLAAYLFSHGCDCISQSCTISFRVARRWRTENVVLPILQIATKHGVAISGESFGEGHEQRCITVAAGAVGENQGFPDRIGGPGHGSAAWGSNGLIKERSGFHDARLCLTDLLRPAAASPSSVRAGRAWR